MKALNRDIVAILFTLALGWAIAPWRAWTWHRVSLLLYLVGSLLFVAGTLITLIHDK